MARHKWSSATNDRSWCLHCGLVRLRRPNPYAGEWFVEWTLPDGRIVDNRGTVPIPCQASPIIPSRERNEACTE